MAPSSHDPRSPKDAIAPVADVLLVRIPQAAIETLPSDFFSHADSGREALGMLKLLRFRLLVASLDVPDMLPWELFYQARRAQAQLQCILLDERLTISDEQRVREAGAGAFASIEPALRMLLVRPSSRTA
jgi:CheY-like chemotaxis protein